MPLKPPPQIRIASPRRVAHSVLVQVVKQGQSLSELQSMMQHFEEKRDRAYVKEIVFGVLRWRWKLEAILYQHMKKKLKAKDIDIQLVLLIAIYEIKILETADYAAVNEAVSLVGLIKKPWAKNMVNAILRNILRGDISEDILKSDQYRYSHPEWLLAKLKEDWPQHWQQIVEHNNRLPPLWCRVNQKRISTPEFEKKLIDSSMAFEPHPSVEGALKFEKGTLISNLPGFDEGLCTIQDAGAQYASSLLDVKSGSRVLDLCAAPGGKAGHILERYDVAELVAVDVSETRVQRMRENLERLQIDATFVTGDAIEKSQWWDGSMFDHILIDAPCSASGVIRRHPDIKSLRRADDFEALCDTQRKILEQAWSMLAVGGSLLYVTCSVFRCENDDQIERFICEHEDAQVQEIKMDAGVCCRQGRQLLPGDLDMDGFYYAKLYKLD